MRYLYALIFIIVLFVYSCGNIEVKDTCPVNMDVCATYYSDIDIIEIETYIYGTTNKDLIIHLDEIHKQLLYNVTIYDNHDNIITDRLHCDKFESNEILIEAPVIKESGKYLITDRVQNINDITRAFICAIGNKQVVPSTVRVRIDLNYGIKGDISKNWVRLSEQVKVEIGKLSKDSIR